MTGPGLGGGLKGGGGEKAGGDGKWWEVGIGEGERGQREMKVNAII